MNERSTSAGTGAGHAQRMARARLSLEGLSVGDALGERFFYDFDAPGVTYATREQAIRNIAERRIPPGPWRYTDDTVMALSICDTLDRLGRIDGDDLALRFAERYRDEPNRGYGAMAHEILARIGQGHPWETVSGSAFGGEGSMGNGGAMRVAPLGAYFADDLPGARENAARSARVTHAHPDGQAGAIAVAVAAAVASGLDGTEERPAELLFRAVLEHTPDGPTRDGLELARGLPAECTVPFAVARLGSGSQVISSDTVPFAVWCASRHFDDFEAAFWTTASGLGDIDTTCAMVGGIVALSARNRGIPTAWSEAREPL